MTATEHETTLPPGYAWCRECAGLIEPDLGCRTCGGQGLVYAATPRPQVGERRSPRCTPAATAGSSARIGRSETPVACPSA